MSDYVRRRAYGWRLLKVLLTAIVLLPAAAFVAGLIHFAAMVDGMERPSPLKRADAIIVLTGGPARITDAFDLLEKGHARRLLITGVHPGTSRNMLASVSPGRDELFECCVDLGYMALNTVGNAKETRSWARSRGYRSLIVVTSNYHLPRSLNELRREMPEAELIPHPVSDRLVSGRWWRDPAAARLLMSEYLKYVMSLMHLRFRPATHIDADIATADAD